MQKGAATTKAKILFTAIELISEIGYEGVSMRMLAGKAGVGASTIYRHFKSKDAILDTILDEVKRELTIKPHYSEDQVRLLLQTEGTHQILRRGTVSYRDGDVRYRLQLYRFLFLEQYQKNAKLQEFTERFFFSEPVARLRELLDILVHLDKIPKTDTAALANVWARTLLISNLAHTHCFTEAPADEDVDYIAMTEFFISCAMRGVTPLEACDNTFTSEPWEDQPPAPCKRRIGTSQRIMRAAFMLIDQHGSNGVSIRDLCAEVGIEPGSFYNHFASKEALLDTLSDRIISDAKRLEFDKDQLKQALRSRDVDKIEAVLAACNAPLRQSKRMIGYRVMFREQFRNRRLREQYWGSIQQNIDATAQALADLMQEGELRQNDAQKIAVIYSYTMAAIHIGSTMFDGELRMMEENRNQACRWVLGLILHGFYSQTPM